MSRITLLPIGGFGEVGRNCLYVFDPVKKVGCFIDAGVLIRRNEMQEQRFQDIMPNQQLLKKIIEVMGQNIVGVVVTHPHNDHLAAVGEISNGFESPIPAFMSKIAFKFFLQICRNNAYQEAKKRYRKEDPRFKSFQSRRVWESLPCNLRNGAPLTKERQYIKSGKKIFVGNFTLTFLPVNHSIPETFCLLIEGNGIRKIFLPDFKIQGYDKNDEDVTINSLKKIIAGGPVDLLGMDALYSSVPGFTGREDKTVQNVRRHLIDAIKRGKTVYLTFHGSHLRLMRELYRVVEEITDSGPGLEGRAMLNAAHIDGLYTGRREDKRQVIFATGCQAEGGETKSALARLTPNLGPNDAVFYLSGAIPGNYDAIKGQVWRQNNQNVEVLLNNGELEKLDLHNCHNVREDNIHASGHERAGGKKQVIEMIYKANKGHPLTVLPYHAEEEDLEAFKGLVPNGVDVKVLKNGETFFV